MAEIKSELVADFPRNTQAAGTGPQDRPQIHWARSWGPSLWPARSASDGGDAIRAISAGKNRRFSRADRQPAVNRRFGTGPFSTLRTGPGSGFCRPRLGAGVACPG